MDSKKYGLSTLGESFLSYYNTINKTYLKHFGKYLMLHYPFYLTKGESLETRQKNLIDYCINKLDDPNGKVLLDIGSGNGTLSVYVYDTYKLKKIIGIDINNDNLSIADQIKGDRDIEFKKDNAEIMQSISNQSVDVAICIESAFHYENKDVFLNQLKRILKDDGKFIIADITAKSIKKRLLLGRWKRKMKYFHWTENQYISGLQDADLTNYNIDDITGRIIKGYSGYNKWTNEIRSKSLINKLMFQTITFIQVKLNIILLKRRRKYLIISGNKS